MTRNKIDKKQLIIPVYLNERIVLDMLAIIEDGFSMVSEVTNVHDTGKDNSVKASGSGSTSVVLSRLLKIQLGGEAKLESKEQQSDQRKFEKFHTNVSLFSKFKDCLNNEKILTCSCEEELDISNVSTGDFIEISGELQKNPMIDFFEKIIDVFKMADVFADEPTVGKKKQVHQNQANDQKILRQIKGFLEELKTSGTIDFIVENKKATVILSAQDQYLQNDNVSELIGGQFKVLGKVIKIAKDENDSIDLLRKTTLGILDDSSMEDILSVFKGDELKQYKLPDVKSKINSPALIIIPLAIYV